MFKKGDINKGFTLIELLVVIAVIGILASVIVASVVTSRNKGADGGVKREIQELRTQAEVYYLNNGNKYYVSAVDNICTSATKYSLTPIFTRLGKLYNPNTTVVTTLATPQTSTNFLICHIDPNNAGYVISTKLMSSSTGVVTSYLCIDSKNNRKQSSSVNPLGQISANAIVCP